MSKDGGNWPNWLIYLSISLVSFLLGALFVGLTLGRVGFDSLEEWAQFGDSLNPLISFVSAILVLIGLVIATNDFKLARHEFKESASHLDQANRLTQENMRDERQALKARNSRQHLEALEHELIRYQFDSGIELKPLGKDSRGYYVDFKVRLKPIKSLRDIWKLAKFKYVGDLLKDEILEMFTTRKSLGLRQSLTNNMFETVWIIDFKSVSQFSGFLSKLKGYKSSHISAIRHADHQEKKVLRSKHAEFLMNVILVLDLWVEISNESPEFDGVSRIKLPGDKEVRVLKFSEYMKIDKEEFERMLPLN